MVCTILALTLAATPLCVTAHAGVDVKGNAGYITVRLFFIPVFRRRFTVESGDRFYKNLVFEHKKKREEIHLNADKNDNKSVRRFVKKMPLLRVIRIRNLTVDVTVGDSDNAFVTTMIIGSLRMLFCMAAAYLHTRESVTVSGTFTPAYNRDVAKAAAFAIVSVSIAGLVVCAVQAVAKIINKRRPKKTVAVRGN